MHPDPYRHDPYQPPPQYVYVQRPEGVTSKTVKGMFWIIALGVGIPMLLCVGLCVASMVMTAATGVEPAPSR